MNFNRKISLFALALFVTANVSFAQVKKRPTPSPKEKPVALATQIKGNLLPVDPNAYTSFDETVYQLPLPTDSVKTFEKGFDILADWAGYVTFDPKEIDSERGVVLEEKRLRGKNAQERLQQQILPVLLNNSRYA